MAKDDNVTKMSEQVPQAPQTVKCFVVPVDAMEQIRDALREAPYKTAKPVIEGMASLQLMDVPVKMPEAQ
jgi:hypothetical protein